MTTSTTDMCTVPQPTVYSTTELNCEAVSVEAFPPFGGLPPTVSVVTGDGEVAMMSANQCRSLAAILLAAARDADAW